MKTPSVLNLTHALRGLRIGAFAVLTVTLLTAGLSTASADAVEDSINLNATATAGSFGSPEVGWPYVPSSSYHLTGVQTKFLSVDGSTVTVEVWEGIPSAGGTMKRTATYVPVANTLGGVTFPTLDLAAGTTYFIGFRNITNLSANITEDAGAQFVSDEYFDDDGLGGYQFSFTHAENPVACQPILAFLGPGVPVNPVSVVLQKGDAVPGVVGAIFTSFGVPSINASGAVAFLGKFKTVSGSGAGIFAGGALVAKIGDELPSGSGVNIKALKDPVIDDAGYVAFPATLSGTGITAANDSAVISNAPGGTLAIVAQEGTTAPDGPAGALWKSFTSIAAPGGGNGVLILGTMQQGVGGIAAANDTGVWSADSAGLLHLVLQEGTTQTGGKTVKSFAVLKAVSKSPGQTHAFNNAAELIAKATFTDGAQAVVHIDLP